MDTNTYDGGSSFSRQKSFEDKTKGNHYNNVQRTPSLRRPQSQKKKENGAKSPFLQRKEFRKETSVSANPSKSYENGSQQNFVRKEYKDTQKFHYPSKSPKASRKIMKTSKNENVNATNKDKKQIMVLVKFESDDRTSDAQKLNIESPNEIKDDEGSAVAIDKESKSDNNENNDVNSKDSDGSPCEEETTIEKIDDSNVKQDDRDQDEDVNVVSNTNQDGVNITEDERKVDEVTNEDNTIVSSQTTQNVVNEVVKDECNEKEEIDKATTIVIDNATENGCNSDNNMSRSIDIAPDIIDREDAIIESVVRDEFVYDTNDQNSKESSDNNSNQINNQNDIFAITSDKVSDVIVETCSEALSVTEDTSVMIVEENDVKHHVNEVPVESINNINDKSNIKSSEVTSPICTDKISSSTADITKDNDEKSEELMEKKESQIKIAESVAEDKGIESEVTAQANSEN